MLRLATEEEPLARDEKLKLLHTIPLLARLDRHHLERLGMAFARARTTCKNGFEVLFDLGWSRYNTTAS